MTHGKRCTKPLYLPVALSRQVAQLQTRKTYDHIVQANYESGLATHAGRGGTPIPVERPINYVSGSYQQVGAQQFAIHVATGPSTHLTVHMTMTYLDFHVPSWTDVAARGHIWIRLTNVNVHRNVILLCLVEHGDCPRQDQQLALRPIVMDQSFDLGDQCADLTIEKSSPV